ncbi:MAG: MFS transporter [Rhodobacteraceae bacterium]|nr:MFS transporter [Paracoccaceae bacterium]
MLALLRHPVFQKLYAAQVVSLLGTGLATVALGLLAFDLAGAKAGTVLGTALAIKMVAYVGIAPVAQALLGKFSAKRVLITLDIIRAGIALLLPFVTEIWHVYTLIFLLQSASAAFTPTFQALIPDILPDEAQYTRALSLSRLTYDLENLISPMLAAALLAVISFHWLFAGTAIGFVLSAAFVLYAPLIGRKIKPATQAFWGRVFNGTRIYLATPRLRGLLSLNLAAAAGSAMILVNTIVITRSLYGYDAQSVGIALAAFGAGSMVTALALPRLLDKTGDRLPMIAGAILLTATMFAGAALFTTLPDFNVFLALWAVAGLGYSAILTPAGRLLRRSSHSAERPALFAAQFALSHACWLLTYPLAGWVGAGFGIPTAFVMLGLIASGAIAISFKFWPHQSTDSLVHTHTDLPSDHPHLQNAHQRTDGFRHAHTFVIDDLHHHWPTHG